MHPSSCTTTRLTDGEHGSLAKALASDVGDDWRGGSHVDRKATERVYAGGKDTKRDEDGLDSADMEEERGCA